MKRKFWIAAATFAVTLMTPTLASAAPVQGLSSSDTATNQALIEAADRAPIELDKRPLSVTLGGTTTHAPYGSYPTRKGVILVTSDAFKGLIPTGHAAIIYTSGQVVESVSSGVVIGSNNWNATKSQAYGVSVRGTTTSQDAAAADWARSQLYKPYNFNYLDTGTRSKFYCSQLVWAAFKDKYGINLDTSAWLGAIHPMELVNTNQTFLLYRKK